MTDHARLHATNISQSKATEPDGNGNYHDVWTVRFHTPSGTQTHVKIPDTHYTAENVAAAMAHEISQVEAVHALDGRELAPPPPTA